MTMIRLVKDVNKEYKDLTPKKMMESKEDHVILITPETFYKVFTPARVRLLMFVRDNKVVSISDLARKVGRKFEAVHRDLRYLQGFGLVKFLDKDKGKIPYISEKIEVEMIGV